MKNITQNLIETLELKKWTKPGTNEDRFYISNKLKINGLSNKEQSEFENHKWYLIETKKGIEIKTSMSFKETKHKYIISALQRIIFTSN